MEGKVYWQEYMSKTKFGLPLEASQLLNGQSEFALPLIFKTWCKGNVNNGKLLLLSIVRELIIAENWSFSLSLQYNQLCIPIAINGNGDFKSGAKSLIEEFRHHIECIDTFQSVDVYGIVISDSTKPNNSNYPILIALNEDLTMFSISCNKIYATFCTALAQQVCHKIDADFNLETNDFSLSGSIIMDDIFAKNNARKVMLSSSWELIFQNSIQWNKNYYANGGDSIQAIRLLSKLKEQGAKVDLTGLLNAFTLELWFFQLDSISSTNRFQEQNTPERYPLTQMQKKIWNHYQSFKEHGAYHEQFLFELFEFPAKEVIEACINAIWKSYPNLRVKIVETEGEFFQEIQDNYLEIKHEYADSIEVALSDDLKLPFSETLLRLKLITISKKNYLLWSHHHIILDGWSVGILIKEFIQRISEQNFDIKLHPNYQYILKSIEGELIVVDSAKLFNTNPFLFEIESYDEKASFITLSFEKLNIHFEKEKQITDHLEITNQLLCCGIAGLVLRSLSNDSDFYFNGISSGRELLNADIDQAVGLFIRNIQIPISVEISSTWKTYFTNLNLNFQNSISSTKFLAEDDHEVTNSDFLFVYENYPYTHLKSTSFEAELIHVNEVTGYPITFCLFPNLEGYSLRIVYDARRFDAAFIEGFKLKFEQIYDHLISVNLDQAILVKTELDKVIFPDIVAFDALQIYDLEEINKRGVMVSFAPNKGWMELFNSSDLTSVNNSVDEKLISFWKHQFFSNLPGVWFDNFTCSKGTFLNFTIEDSSDTIEFLVTLSNGFNQLIWKDSGFQFIVQKEGVEFPLIIDASSSEKEMFQQLTDQMHLVDQYIIEFGEILKNIWEVNSNFLVLIDSEPTDEQRSQFDLILSKNKSILTCYKSGAISSIFVEKLKNLLSSNKEDARGISDELSFLTNDFNIVENQHSTFIHRFNQSAINNPNLIAIDDGVNKLTYRELDHYSDCLALHLRGNFNVANELFIGVLLSPSTDQLCAIIAILKLSKAFIPLDVEWPEIRINQVVNQSGIKLIIDKDVFEKAKLSNSVSTLEITSQLSDPLYSLFTSGSTGIPKGCVISELAFSNYLNHCENNYFKHAENSRIHVFTPISFDFTLTSFLGGLAFGLTIVIHSEKNNIYDSLKAALFDSESLIIKLTPSHINLCEEIWFKDSTPKIIIVGGEALLNSQIEKCLLVSSHRLINEYGPTEATVGCVFQEIQLNELPLIGLPIQGMGVMVVNEKNQIVVKGREGELCLLGAGLAEGYLNDQLRTSNSFSSWEEDNTLRIYKTGDLVKMQQDGSLIYLSRKDEQIKLNGYRIEVDEIRIIVKEVSGFESTTIVIEKNNAKQLVCFVEGRLRDLDIQSSLVNRLPSYMVPSIFIEIDTFPITANGKLNQKKLINIFNSQHQKSSSFLSPVFNFGQMLDKWASLDSKYKYIVSPNSICQKGWKLSYEQIEYLDQLSNCNSQIYFPNSIKNSFPEFSLDSTSINETSSISYNNHTILIENLVSYANVLSNHDITFPENYGYLFSKTIQNLSSVPLKISPKIIESKEISYLNANDVALISDWSYHYGFPIIVKKSSTGKLLSIIPNSNNKVVIDNLGFNQPSSWKGHLFDVNNINFDFLPMENQVQIIRKSFIQRFSYKLSLEFIESLVYKHIKNVLCVLALEKQDQLIVLVNSTTQIELSEINEVFNRYLPFWCKVKEVFFTEDIAAKEKELFEGVGDSFGSDFQSFLDEFLPEYTYLQGDLSLIEQGGDSITALRIVGRLKNKGFQIEVGNLLNAASIAEYFLSLAGSLNTVVSSHFIQLTPIQEWFLNEYPGNKNHFNQSILLELLISVDPVLVRDALQVTLDNQTILSSIYKNGWEKGKTSEIKIIHCDSEDEVTSFCATVQQSFDLNFGPVAGGAILNLNGKVLLFIAIHHLYCDGYSWRIILDDLQESLQGRNVKKDSSIAFGKTKSQFLELCSINKKATTSFYGNEIMHPFKELSHYTYKSSNYVEWEWSIEETKWFQLTHDIGNTANEKFLFLFIKTWLELGNPSTTIFLETHGRFYNGVSELTDSIGWFTQFYPIFSQEFPRLENLKGAIANQFENLPENGLTYMGENDWVKPPFPVLLNFLGNFDENRGGIAVPSTISQGEMTDLSNPVLSFVELNAMIIEGKMKWMLRMHPTMQPNVFMDKLNCSVKEYLNNQNNTDYIAQSIDQDDLDAINNLLGGI